MSAHDAIMIAGALFAGTGLGAVFFGGLWLTVRRTLSSPSLSLLLVCSFLFRAGIVLVGFKVVCGGDWRQLIACLLGFLVARLVIERLLSAKHIIKGPESPDAYHAS